jgi:hypothetical protein
MSELPPDQQALLKQAREANLLKAWAGGRRKLSASELAEIAHLIPSTSPPTDPPPEPSGRRKRAKYAKKLSEYEAIYETSYRNLRRWIATGIQKGKPVPLDDPGAMAGWWIDCMKHIVPAKIAALAAQPALAAGPHVGNDVTGPLPPVDPSKQLPALDIDLSVLGKDPGKIVQQAQALVDAAYMKLEQGYRIPDDAMLRPLVSPVGKSRRGLAEAGSKTRSPPAKRWAWSSTARQSRPISLRPSPCSSACASGWRKWSAIFSGASCRTSIHLSSQRPPRPWRSPVAGRMKPFATCLA